MAVLVVAGGTPLDRFVVQRLLDQGDEVRVLGSARGEREEREEWSALGAYVAVGEVDDPDLVERAAQNVRTIVLLGDGVEIGVVRTLLEAAPKAGVDRLVCCAPRIPQGIRATVTAAPLSYVLIETGRRGILHRRAVSSELIAEAVDAADDLAGEPRLDIDLGDPTQRSLLGL